MNTSPLIWVLVDDRPGNAGQAIGVAEALGLPFVQKSVGYTSLGKLPNIVRGATLIGVTPETVEGLCAPWPNVVISAGRRTAPVARWIKKQAANKIILAHIMNPGRVGADDFDVVAVPNHDCARPDGDLPNALRITGAPHRFSPARLNTEAAAWAPKLAHLPRPYFALFIGGATRQRPFPAELAAEVTGRVAARARAANGSVLVSTSRRTGAEAEIALLRALGEGPHNPPRDVFLWGQEQGTSRANPFAGYLALADTVAATGDSVSMCSEACANSNAVYIYAPSGMVADKHARLHAELFRRGLARPFDDVLEAFTHPPLNAAAVVAARVRALLEVSGTAIVDVNVRPLG